MLYVLHCRDDMRVSARIRAEHLEAHLAYIDRHQDLIVLGGAMLAEDGRTRTGSTLILNVPDRAAAEAFSLAEPFRCAGLYASVEIDRMRRAQWRPDRAPATPDGN
jgi:uncharacterized protein YciI